MNFTDYQDESRKTAIYPNLGNNWVYPLLGLSGEAGELANTLKKVLRDHDGRMTEDVLAKVRAEIGDCIWYMANLCTELNLSLGAIAADNLEKLQRRQQRGTLHGSGEDR